MCERGSLTCFPFDGCRLSESISVDRQDCKSIFSVRFQICHQHGALIGVQNNLSHATHRHTKGKKERKTSAHVKLSWSPLAGLSHHQITTSHRARSKKRKGAGPNLCSETKQESRHFDGSIASYLMSVRRQVHISSLKHTCCLAVHPQCYRYVSL